MHRRILRDGRILNCRTGVEPDTRCPTGIPAKIDRAKDEFIVLGPSLPIDNVLLILKKKSAGKRALLIAFVAIIAVLAAAAAFGMSFDVLPD